jgi:hypothetical protein
LRLGAFFAGFSFDADSAAPSAFDGAFGAFGFAGAFAFAAGFEAAPSAAAFFNSAKRVRSFSLCAVRRFFATAARAFSPLTLDMLTSGIALYHSAFNKQPESQKRSDHDPMTRSYIARYIGTIFCSSKRSIATSRARLPILVRRASSDRISIARRAMPSMSPTGSR